MAVGVECMRGHLRPGQAGLGLYSKEKRRQRVQNVLQNFSLALFGEDEVINLREGTLKEDEIWGQVDEFSCGHTVFEMLR